MAKHIVKTPFSPLQVWRYNEGVVTHVGHGHSAEIKKVKISPNQRYIVSVSTDGSIIVWQFPQTESGDLIMQQQLECS